MKNKKKPEEKQTERERSNKNKKSRIKIINRREFPGVIIIAPGGEIVNAGIAYTEEAKNEHNDDEVLYRLYESLLPFLYFTHKLNRDLELNFEHPPKLHPSKKIWPFIFAHLIMFHNIMLNFRRL